MVVDIADTAVYCLVDSTLNNHFFRLAALDIYFQMPLPVVFLEPFGECVCVRACVHGGQGLETEVSP